MKGFCGGSRGAVFSKRAPLAAFPVSFLKSVGQLMKFFFKAFGEIGGTGEAHLYGYFRHIAEIGFQQLGSPFQTVGLDKFPGGFAG